MGGPRWGARQGFVDSTSFEPIDTETPDAIFAVDRVIGDLRRGGGP